MCVKYELTLIKHEYSYNSNGHVPNIDIFTKIICQKDTLNISCQNDFYVKGWQITKYKNEKTSKTVTCR